mmetsp:Transcript_148119/g.258429  ORF Transcript_148119/g.258429 Transcript_148119/m.258429 type:complete len:302 (+) Transcript_148119:67-972(+)
MWCVRSKFAQSSCSSLEDLLYKCWKAFWVEPVWPGTASTGISCHYPTNPLHRNGVEANCCPNKPSHDGCICVRVATADHCQLHCCREITSDLEVAKSMGECNFRPTILRTKMQGFASHCFLQPFRQILTSWAAFFQLFCLPVFDCFQSACSVPTCMDQLSHCQDISCICTADSMVRMCQLCIRVSCRDNCMSVKLASTAPHCQRHTAHQCSIGLGIHVHLPSSMLHVYCCIISPPHSLSSGDANVERPRRTPIMVILRNHVTGKRRSFSCSGQAFCQHDLHLSVISDLARGHSPSTTPAHL